MRKNKEYISDVQQKIIELHKLESGFKKKDRAGKIPISMEARFRHWIKNKKGYCDFLSHNSDFFSQNYEFMSRNSDFFLSVSVVGSWMSSLPVLYVTLLDSKDSSVVELLGKGLRDKQIWRL